MITFCKGGSISTDNDYATECRSPPEQQTRQYIPSLLPNSVSFSLSPDPEQRVSIKGWAELRQITLSSQPQIETFDGPPTTISQRRFGEGDDNEEMSFGLWCDLCETNEWTCRRDESSARLERVGLPDKTDSYGIIKALSVCLDILSQIHALMEPTTKSTKQQPTIIITTV